MKFIFENSSKIKYNKNRCIPIEESTSFKRIARYNEFDNGHVLFDYSRMTDDEAEEAAKLASIKDGTDVYYVKYDDIMNPASDISWYKGQAYRNCNMHDIKSGKCSPIDESLNENLIEAPQEVVDEVVKVLDSYGFVLDPAFKVNPGKTWMGNIHMQVINTKEPVRSHYDLKRYVPNELVDELREIENTSKCPITWNFGINRDGYVTGGIDISKKYVEENLEESFSPSINLDDVAQKVWERLQPEKVGEKNWIDFYADEPRKMLGTNEQTMSFEAVGENKTLKGSFRTSHGRIEVAFRYGSEAMCDSIDDIVRFIYAEVNGKALDEKQDADVRNKYKDEDLHLVSNRYSPDDPGFDEYNIDDTDFNDVEVEEGNRFFADGKDYIWEERIAGPIHLDFDNWAVWSARESVNIFDYATEKPGGGYEVDRDAFMKAYMEAPVAYFVVDEDTGFIDWGPCDTDIEAKEFLNSKVEDWEDDTNEPLSEDYGYTHRCPKCGDDTGEELETDSYGHKTFRCASCGYYSENESEWVMLDESVINEDMSEEDYDEFFSIVDKIGPAINTAGGDMDDINGNLSHPYEDEDRIKIVFVSTVDKKDAKKFVKTVEAEIEKALQTTRFNRVRDIYVYQLSGSDLQMRVPASLRSEFSKKFSMFEIDIRASADL